MSETTTIPPQKFQVGDPVSRHDGKSLDFIASAIWTPAMNTWRYGIHFSQENMCSLTAWQGGGSCYWESEDELKHPVGEQKLRGELWRQLRSIEKLKSELKECQQKAHSIQFSLALMTEKL